MLGSELINSGRWRGPEPSQQHGERQPHGTALQPKFGLGLEFKLSEAPALRGEIERCRVRDGVRGNGRPDLLSLNLEYQLGRPAARRVH